MGHVLVLVVLRTAADVPAQVNTAFDAYIARVAGDENAIQFASFEIGGRFDSALRGARTGPAGPDAIVEDGEFATWDSPDDAGSPAAIARNVGPVATIPAGCLANAVLHGDGTLEFFGWLPAFDRDDALACAAGMQRLRASAGTALVVAVDARV